MTELSLTHEVCGYYKIEIKRENGEMETVADWFQNLITNGGMNRRAGNADYLLYCQVGTGNTTPSYTDTELASKLAHTSSATSSSGDASSAPYYSQTTKIYSFPAGTATGNISEVGVGWLSNGGLSSRALIVDGDGNPTTITVLSSESLYVTYQLRIYAPTVDVTGSVELDGVTYNYTSRAAQTTTSSAWDAYVNELETQATSCWVYTGAIQGVTTKPSGTEKQASTTQVALSYSADSYTAERQVTWALANGNLTGGIGAIMIDLGSGRYQIGFDSPIPKDSSKTLSLTFRWSWARR